MRRSALVVLASAALAGGCMMKTVELPHDTFAELNLANPAYRDLTVALVYSQNTKIGMDFQQGALTGQPGFQPERWFSGMIAGLGKNFKRTMLVETVADASATNADLIAVVDDLADFNRGSARLSIKYSAIFLTPDQKPIDVVVGTNDGGKVMWTHGAMADAARLAQERFDKALFASPKLAEFARDAARGRQAPLRAPSPRPGEGWSLATPLPVPRYYADFVNAGGKVYVMGGSDQDHKPTDRVDVFDAASGVWSRGPSLPERLSLFVAAELKGKVYVIGGCVESDCRLYPTRHAWVLDPRGGAWSAIAPLPAPVADGQAGVYGGRLYVFGGIDNETAAATAFAYDPGRNEWSRLKDLPRPTTNGAGAFLSGRFYYAGGCVGRERFRYGLDCTDAVLSYSPATDSWTTGVPLPIPLFNAAAIVRDGRLIVTGGDSGKRRNLRTFVYDPATSRWSPGADLPRSVEKPNFFAWGRDLAIHGGAGDGPEPTAEILVTRDPFVHSGPEASYAPAPLSAGVREEAGESEEPSDIDAPPPARSLRPHSYAVVIGVEHYREKLPNADFSASDAKLAAEYFERVLGVPAENMALLTEDRAAKSDFEKYFERWLPNRVEAGDTVYVYYSGHGAPNPAKGDAYLVPYDADPTYIEQTGYPVQRMFDDLAKLPAKQVFVAMDSCFSGAGGRSVIAKGARPLVSVVQSDVPSNMTVLSASAGDQISNSYQAKGHGLFTYFFLKGLKEKDGDIRAAFDYLKPEVARTARREFNSDQEPQWRQGR